MTTELRNATVIVGAAGLNGGGITVGQLNTAIADRAPDNATYITQTANAELGSEQALSSLATGLVKVTTGTGVLSTATGSDVPSHSHTAVVFGVNVLIDGGGSVITTGIKGDIRIPFACTITEWNLYADQVGSIVINLWRDHYANFPPTVADAITGSSKPTLTAVNKNADAGLAGWTTAVGFEDIIRINVDSASTVTRVTLVLKLTRTI